MKPSDPLRRTLDRLAVEAHQHFVPEGLPSAANLRSLMPSFDERAWQQASPLDRYFMVLLCPAVASAAPVDEQCQAFVEASATLPGDGWELGDATKSAAVQAWSRLPCAESTWVSMLLDERPFRLSDSESATLSKRYLWEVGDLAGLILSKKYSVPFDPYAEVDQRRIARKALAITRPASGIPR
jgi:hypothetical protein